MPVLTTWDTAAMTVRGHSLSPRSFSLHCIILVSLTPHYTLCPKKGFILVRFKKIISFAVTFVAAETLLRYFVKMFLQ